MHRLKNIVFKNKDLSEVITQILRTVLSFSNCIIIVSSFVLIFTGQDLGEPELIQSRKAVIYVCIWILMVGLLGLVGSILEHFGLMIAYSLLWTIIVIIKAAELRPDNCLSFIIALALCICSVIYAILIRVVNDDSILLSRKFSRKIAG
jgi:hypothetical protein